MSILNRSDRHQPSMSHKVEFDISHQSKSLFRALLTTIHKTHAPQVSLAVDYTPGNLFEDCSAVFDKVLRRTSGDHGLEIWIDDKDRYDFIAAHGPFGIKLPASAPKLDKTPPTYSIGLAEIIAKSLSDRGLGLMSVEPSVAYGNHYEALCFALRKNRCSVVAFFCVSSGFWKPMTSIRAPFILFGKGDHSDHFIGLLESAEQTKKLVSNFFADVAVPESTSDGVRVPAGSFKGLASLQAKHQLEQLESDFKDFTFRRLAEVALEINSVRGDDKFLDKENAIYVPTITRVTTATRLESELTHAVFIQVVLDKTVVLNEYLQAFFQSPVFELYRTQESGYSDVIPRLSNKELENFRIPTPPLSVQHEIISTLRKLGDVQRSINDFSKTLSLNPISAKTSVEKIDSILGVIGELADADRAINLIRRGESKTLEFKETLSWDKHKNTREKYIEDSALKTVAAFLNSDGGILLIGVHDSGTLVGINGEIQLFHKSPDKYLLHLKNLIKNRIGEPFYPFIDQKLVSIGSQIVCMIECKSSPKEVFLDSRDFYVRTNPATDKLEGMKLLEYVQHRFKSAEMKM